MLGIIIKMVKLEKPQNCIKIDPVIIYHIKISFPMITGCPSAIRGDYICQGTIKV